jgi:glycosyltransferase involved in cell wall biosynthesis
MQTGLDVDVSFYLPDRRGVMDIDPLGLDPERDWAVFGTGVYVWILQTFVRLHRAGAPVRLLDRPPARGVTVVHADHVERLLSEAPSPTDLTIVVARSDRGPQWLADFVIVQNASSAGRGDFFIPSWSQPGLIPRDPGRGTRVERVAYVGAIKELDPELAVPAWEEALRGRGLEWDLRAITFAGSDRVYPKLPWNDYSTVDVVVALRPRDSWDVRSKPAAKLQNAWAAGVPAIVSPEIAYRELRVSSRDFLEARSRSEALAAIDALRSNPSLYAEMVTNGLKRAREFEPERLIERWIDVLWRQIPKRTTHPLYRILVKARAARALGRRVRDRWGS